MLDINGYGDELTVNGIRIGDLSPKEHEQIEREKGGQKYSPLESHKRYCFLAPLKKRIQWMSYRQIAQLDYQLVIDECIQK